MADTSIKLSGTYDSIEAYRILEEMREMSEDYEDIKEEAEAASSAATAASTAATNAVNAANTAVSNAQTYAGNANTSASDAAGYAANANTSATNAAASETNASNSATAAAGSATAATASETAAAASEAAAAAALATIEAKYAQAILAAHPVGSFYESTDSTSPATLFGGTWQEQIPDGELIGSIAYFAGQSSAPDGWILCDGSAVSRDTYATLFSAVGTTYGAGDGSTTFNLPNLVDKFVEGSATSGTVKSAGLPNINGRLSVRHWGVSEGGCISPDGSPNAFKGGGVQQSQSAGFAGNGQLGKGLYLDFSAQNYNSIYGNSTTVQPPALTMKPFIYTGKTALYKWLRTA